MDSIALNFLTELLGTEGAKALARSATKEPILGHLLVPRTALSWLQRQDDYEGTVPGVPNSYLKFAKSDKGFTGLVTLETVNYEFADAAPEHLAAALSVSVGSGVPSPSGLGDLTIQRLGKSIDLLVGAHFVTQRLIKNVHASLGLNIREEQDDKGLKVHAFDKKGKHVASAWFENHENQLRPIQLPEDSNMADTLTEHAKNFAGKHITKAEVGSVAEHGATAQPFKQKGPIEPEAPSKQKGGINAAQNKPKLPKVPALKVEKSEMIAECPACGGTQFQGNKFKGCLCVRDFAGLVKATVYSDGAVLEFKAGFEPEALAILRKSMKAL